MDDLTIGGLVADAVRQSWRAEPPPPGIGPDVLTDLVPLLAMIGLGGLVARAAHRPASGVPDDLRYQLEDVWRLERLRQRAYERRIANVLRTVEGADADVLLLKGWTLSRCYPEAGLRPSGDLDLLVAPDARESVRRLLGNAGPLEVDLDHEHVTIDGTPFEDLLRRATTATLPDGTSVRVLGAEDRLRLKALHFMRAGGWRCLSLVDVAVLLERRDAGFDWSIALPGDEPRRTWVSTACALAADLLGADTTGTPLQGAVAPAWVRTHVLQGLGQPPAARVIRRWRRTTSVRQVAGQVRARWPDPLEIAVHRGTPLDRRRRSHELSDIGLRTLSRVVPLSGVRVPPHRRRA
jgi:hypothetical protein